MATYADVEPSIVYQLFENEEGYATPKVDVRAAVFQDNKILLVKERKDGCWTLPGGWVDVGESPSEAIVREVYEESGYQTKVIKLLALYDRNHPRHQHPPLRHHVYKLFVIPDDVAVLTWDGIKREIPARNRDTNLRQAFKDSTVWFYQVLARKIGHQRMQQFIEKVNYGNRQVGTPEQIDRFWLEGPLQITPKQEIEFLQRLESNNLPFSERTLDLVKDIMIVERTPAYTLRGKTGWINSVTPNFGWFIGYLQQNNNVYFFATNMTIVSANDAPKRLEITRRSLKLLGLI